jgi:hypothetical protein
VKRFQAANIFNVLANYVLIYATGMGIQGAPVATSITRTFQLAGVLIYLKLSSRHRCASARGKSQNAPFLSVFCPSVFAPPFPYPIHVHAQALTAAQSRVRWRPSHVCFAFCVSFLS